MLNPLCRKVNEVRDLLKLNNIDFMPIILWLEGYN